MRQRLGWLLVVLFFTMKFTNHARAIPASTNELASELKVGSTIIRVRLSELGRSLKIKGNGLAASLAMKPELGNVQADEWEVDCKRSRILQPETGKSRAIPRSGILIESISGLLSINGKRFRDQIVVYPQELLSPYDKSIRSNSQCLVVNHLPVEKYLESVVNGEFNSKWAEPAVEAQIIAARTYAYYQMKEMRKDRGRVYDVESTQKYQVYLGFDVTDTKATQLVAKTRGMILSDPDNKKKRCPIKAFYHASCGGGTFLPGEIWGGRFAGFKRVNCHYCAGSPSFNWEYSMSFREIEKRITRGIEVDSNGRKAWPSIYLKNPAVWYLVGIRPQGGMDRVSEVIFDFMNLETQKPLSVTMNAYQLRNWLDPSQLKSTRFRLELNGRLAIFRGKGSGHGVGLCQWGAKKMGEQGYSRDQILTHYYPGFKLVKIL
jgi:stage II sporulation protein D